MKSITSCSGLQRSEKEKIRRRNCVSEEVHRTKDEESFSIGPLKPAPKAPYLWQSDSNLPRITKDFFRCKGCSLNQPRKDLSGLIAKDQILDCEGGTKHGLPMIGKTGGVYPILIDLLNYVQKKTRKRVVITSGHRCPIHNAYVDSSKSNQTSKHQIGAEVNFYVQGMEDRPLEVVGLLMQYYQEAKESKENQNFTRYTKNDTGVSTPPWMNKEVYIKLFQKDEGRNFDNRHPHPYIDIQVRFDREKNERVVYSWEKANKNYSRTQ